jgi:hypothetical protein
LLLAIAWGALFCGLGDLGFAFVFYGLHGATPLGIMQSIAGGLMGGPAAHAGGVPTAILGVMLHFVISLGAATVYCLLSRRWYALINYAVPCGLGYGVVVFYFMNMVVRPLSAYHSRPFPPPTTPIPILGHMVLVGLPIALAARYFLRRKNVPSPAQPEAATAA